MEGLGAELRRFLPGLWTEPGDWTALPVTIPNRSATAITEASVVPNGRSAYLRTSSAISRIIRRRQIDGLEVTVGEGLQKTRLGLRASLAFEQIADLRAHSRGNQNPPLGQVQTREHLDRGMMVDVVGQGRGH
ncbi:hypothetical protein NFA_44300 [Nocardia farcinica IFM 10152]|uniref:Uncharacterized protein n=2 Tax=Nocardia farcinica TaxID=37329 RepID=Q5YRB0_NOCFA|nr:hypothetical protein NFA_44300 [Nocardia farcinica IFM 10152]